METIGFTYKKSGKAMKSVGFTSDKYREIGAASRDMLKFWSGLTLELETRVRVRMEHQQMINRWV